MDGVLLPVLVSIIEVYSASSQLTYKASNYTAPVLKHIMLIVIGIVCMVVTLNVKCRYFKMLRRSYCFSL